MKRLKSNSAVVLSAMLKKKMTARQAAKAAGIGNNVFATLVRADRFISPKTAGKLRETFGDDAVMIQ